MISGTRFLLAIVLALTVALLMQDQSVAGKRRGSRGKHGMGKGMKHNRPFLGFGRDAYFGGYGLGYYGLGGPFEMPYAMGRIPTPPYFALHPPVHYSHAVPRTYGYSPWAYPGTFMTPDVNVIEPAEVINPYVEPEASSGTEATNHVAAIPVVIRNPFVDQSGEIQAEQRPTIEIARSLNE